MDSRDSTRGEHAGAHVRRAVRTGFIAVLVVALGGIPSSLGQGQKAGIQFDSVFLGRDDLPDGLVPVSPFAALEIGLMPRVSVRLGVSPPLSKVRGQAFASNVALNVCLGTAPSFMELGIGSYYQNTWCNAVPNYTFTTASLGWRRVSGKLVVRIGGMIGFEMLESKRLGKPAFGLTFGIGRAIEDRLR